MHGWMAGVFQEDSPPNKIESVINQFEWKYCYIYEMPIFRSDLMIIYVDCLNIEKYSLVYGI